MGCCSSSLVDQGLLTRPTENNNTTVITTTVPLPEAYYCESQPFKRIGLMWTSDTPLTVTQLEQKRYLYWETAPNYGGRIEIWQALQVAFSETMDVIMARSILEAINIILPTGNPCEGCFDELGTQYEIPIYCIVSPTNLSLTEDQNDTTTTSLRLENSTELSTMVKKTYSDHHHHLVPAPDCSKKTSTVMVRLSTEQDLELTISSDNETIGSLRSRIFEKSNMIDPETHIVRLIYLGQILKDTMHIIICEEYNIEQTFSEKNSVRVQNDSIIQALVATKR